MKSDRERLDEFFQEQRITRAIRDGVRQGTGRNEYAEAGQRAREGIQQFNASTRNRALLLAASKRLRRTYLWGSTFVLFVLSPLLVFAPGWLSNYFGQKSLWWLVPMFLGGIVLPLCALRGYFIWVRSHWYRWIGQGIKDDYEEGELLPSKRRQRQENKLENARQQYRRAVEEAEAEDRSDEEGPWSRSTSTKPNGADPTS